MFNHISRGLNLTSLKNYLFHLAKIYQWLIVDFPKSGANFRRGCTNLLFCKNFAEKCMKVKEFGPRGMRAPLGSATVYQRCIPWFLRTHSRLSCSRRGPRAGHRCPYSRAGARVSGAGRRSPTSDPATLRREAPATHASPLTSQQTPSTCLKCSERWRWIVRRPHCSM